MSDKDMIERDALTEQVPTEILLICLFHTLHSMKREVSCDELGIFQGEKSMCLEIMSKIAYAQTVEAYSILYDQLKQCTPQPQLIVTEYGKRSQDN